MTAPGSITLAFAGAGKVTDDNVADLLNDWLGFGPKDEDGFYAPSDRDINLIFPVTRKHLTAGIKTVLNWSEQVDLPFIAITDDSKSRGVTAVLNAAEETHQAVDVTAKVMDFLRAAPGEKYLVLLWGDGEDETSEEAELLLDAATEAGIPAKDLTAGLDDLSFSDTTPEPEPEPPKRRRRAAAAVETTEEEPRDRAAEGAALKTEAADRRAKAIERTNARNEEKRAALEAEADAKDEQPADLPHDRQTEDATIRLEVIPPDFTPLTLKTLRVLLVDALAALDSRLEPETVQQNGSAAPEKARRTRAAKKVAESTDDEQQPLKRGRGRPRKDGSSAQPRDPEDLKIAVIQMEDGTFRKRGRGRPAKGEQIIKVTAEELAEMTLVDA